MDSGVTLNFINETLVTALNLTPVPCHPVDISVADGRLLLHANREVTLEFSIAGIRQKQTFVVAPIGQHSIILGMPWLEHCNPTIDWVSKEVSVPRTPLLEPQSSETPEPVPLEPQSPETPSLSEPPTSEPSQPRRSGPRKQKKPPPPWFKPPPRPVPPPIRLTTRLSRHDEVYLLMVNPASADQPITSQIPKEYRDLSEVFNKEKAHELPPHRGPVTDGAQPRAVQGARTARTLNKFHSGRSVGDHYDDEHYGIYIRDGYFN